MTIRSTRLTALFVACLLCASAAPLLAVDWLRLLHAATSPQLANELDQEALKSFTENTKPETAIWPVSGFLLGETYRLRGDFRNAKEQYRSITEWAAGRPYNDEWGGSGLACVSLYRWLQLAIAEDSHNSDEVGRMLEASESLQDSRFMRRMFRTEVLGSMPLMEEEILRFSALLAWKTGKTEEATRKFLDYLGIASTSKLSAEEMKIKEQILAAGLISEERLALFRGKRLYSLGKYDDAAALLTEAQAGKDTQVQTEAAFYMARLKREIKHAPRAEVAALLQKVIETTTDPSIAQEALLYRSRTYFREGAEKDVVRSQQDLQRILDQYPNGQFVDDALYELARREMDAGNLEQALKYFEELRNWKGPNQWTNLAAFQPAMILYGMGKPEDLEKAAELLKQLDRQEPSGPLHLQVLFWLGRIASDTGNESESKAYFETLVKEAPYEYHGIRARMHLHAGREAAVMTWPDGQTAADLHTAFANSALDTEFRGKSPYHVRLRAAFDSGLYSAVLKSDGKLRELYPSRRLEDLSMDELDHANLLPSEVLLLAFRQDALAAKDAGDAPENRLQVAGAVGKETGDWPLAMNLVINREEPLPQRLAPTRDPRFLATAYPIVYQQYVLKTSVDRQVSPELLYSIMRRESFFYPTALSANGALGLFQFLPATFDEMNRRWKLLQTSKTASREAYLLNPELSIQLGGIWFKDELLQREKGNVPLAIMEHHAGYPAVREWVKTWKAQGRDNDFEYMMDTVRILATRLFVREVYTDMVHVQSAGIFQKQ